MDVQIVHFSLAAPNDPLNDNTEIPGMHLTLLASQYYLHAYLIPSLWAIPLASQYLSIHFVLSSLLII
jgi:hypothetical protein